MKDAKLYSQRLLDLMSELVSFNEIKRQIHLPSGESENDSEHSYSLAMCAWYLSQYVPELNQEKVLKFALTHDLVELHAGDVMAIGRTDKEEELKIAKEKEALIKLKQDWPDFVDMTSTIEKYELKDSKEAIFVWAIDKLLPIQLNILSKGFTWKKYDLKREEVINNRDSKLNNVPDINKIWAELRNHILDNDDYFN
jgi:putative hydrolase of HD superfamily